MAPHSHSRLPSLLLFLQITFILIYAFYTDIKINFRAAEINFSGSYSEFQDVNLVVIFGFGFLGTFLVRYGFSSCGFNLLVAALVTQWAIILNGFESWYHIGTIRLDLRSVVVAEMCTASALISMGAVLGKTNPLQLVLIALLEVSAFVLNRWLVQTLLKVRPLNSIMLLHVFGSSFGLMLSRVLHQEASEEQFEKEKSDRTAGLFSMMGSVFLWMFWPSFNSILVDGSSPGRKLGAACSTYLSLAVSALTAAATSVLCSPKGKLHPGHMQTCILAGGVAIGVSMAAVRQPWEAMTVGFLAAVVSAVGFRYLQVHMLRALQCRDTCDVLSAHGLPGLLGWLVLLILQIKDSDDHTTAARFAVFHICTLFITLSLSLSTGILTGILLKWNFWKPPQGKKCFDDQAFWVFPHLAKGN
ncbi:rh blood group, D antigen [Thalassophryne amazonica]|uniref:rh blood group, D antigen n=1 Tax=Thalassophryne amazonica TaxID=390379 RepID=UPI0014714949|nr:rh blood group, D antigen [Thalassophryne amazonica]